MQKTKIDWADMTWNPVTGCLHECEYCYAKKIANRFGKFYGSFCLVPHKEKNVGTLGNPLFELNEKRYLHKNNAKPQYLPYPFSFKPTLHRYRLDEPKCKTKGRTIFVCSMADLFGEWVPDSWIKAVFEACEEAPQHRYLFLTKNPAGLKYPFYNYFNHNHNWWIGTSITGLNDCKRAYELYQETSRRANKFLSIEPLLYELDFEEFDIEEFNWVIIGAETGNRKDKVIPKREWVDNIISQCRSAGVPVFLKSSLLEVMEGEFIQEYPWEV